MEYTYIHNHQSQFIEWFGNSEMIELGNVATFINGSAFKPEEWASDGLPIIRIQNLTDPSASYNYYSGTDAKVIIESGDVLVSWSATLDVYLWNQGEAVLNQHIFKVVFDKIGIDKDFFVYTVKSKLVEMVSKAHGSTMKHIVKKDFETTLVPYPSFEKQKEFAEIVRQADKSKFDGFKSQFIEMFGTLTNPKFEVKNLGNCCDVERGGSPRPISEYITDSPEGINWIKIGDADEGMYITSTKEKILTSGIKKSRMVFKGDLLLSNSMSFGRPYILNIDGCIHDGWLVLHFDKALFNSEYLCSYLSQQSTYTELAKLADGAVVSNLNKEIVKILPVIAPPMALQEEFTAVIRQADKSKYNEINETIYGIL